MIKLVSENRSNFRVKFPYGHRPVASVRTFSLQLADISETGMKFISAPGYNAVVGEAMRGKITFADGWTEHFQGEIVRIIGDLIAIKLTHHFDRTRLEAEMDCVKQIPQPAKKLANSSAVAAELPICAEAKHTLVLI